MAFVAKTALLSCVAVKASLRGIYYKWSKDFMEAGKKRLAGDTARAANTDEVKDCAARQRI